MRESLSPSTQTAYRSIFEKYAKFVARLETNNSNSTANITPELVALFIADCYKQGLAVATVQTYISALGFFAKLKGLTDVSQTFAIKRMLSGYQKKHISCDTRLPITPIILSKLIHSLPFVCKSMFSRVLVKAMYLLAFHAFLRIGEITGTKDNHGNCIRKENVKILSSPDEQNKHIELTFSTFKHSAGKHIPTIVIKENSIQNLCPVKAICDYCNLRDSKDGPFFKFMDDSPVSRQYFTQHLQASLAWAGYDYKHYKGHSFRIGAATTAAEKGINEEKIQAMGRWHSAAYKKYIRIHSITLD
ncbi:hypothetical protein FSP39_020005 [Pinctada imbricata]|uniref:Core-binding (CB) domain-containing protein n=1 Tax=Pinctada imbricata TaxID=66713 RepID=A0AA88XQD6_PINIB|nr:hypothetical protein FSP39_020005 [Pinctada imbricata]